MQRNFPTSKMIDCKWRILAFFFFFFSKFQSLFSVRKQKKHQYLTKSRELVLIKRKCRSSVVLSAAF